MATGLEGHHNIAKGDKELNRLLLEVIPEWKMHADYNLSALANTLQGAAQTKRLLHWTSHEQLDTTLVNLLKSPEFTNLNPDEQLKATCHIP